MTTHNESTPGEAFVTVDLFNKRIDEVIERINSHTTHEFNELASVTAKQFRIIEKRIDVFEQRADAKFERMDSQFEDIKDHLVVIDNRIGVRPTFAFRRS